MATPRLIPDHECKQGKCGATTTGCWDQCSLKQFPVNFVGLAFPVAPLIPTEQQPANEESEADCALIQRLGGLLAEIAIVMKGPEPARTRWSYADLPKLVEVMAVELDMYRTVYGTTFPEGWGTPPAVTAKPDLVAPEPLPSFKQFDGYASCRGAAEARHKAAVLAAPVEQASAEPYRVRALEAGESGEHWQIWKGKRKIASINGRAFRSFDAEREEAEKIVAALGAASIPPLQAPEPAPESVRDAARFVFQHMDMDFVADMEQQALAGNLQRPINWWRARIDAAMAKEKAQ